MRNSTLRFAVMALVVLATVFSASAQKKDSKAKREEMRKEMRDFKVKFIAQEIDLQESQSKRFVELYNQMSDEKDRLFHETRKMEKRIAGGEATDEEYAQASRVLTEAKEKDAEIEKKYDAKFSTFLSAKQIFKMKGAEEKFRRKIHEMHSRKHRKSQHKK